MTDEDEPLPISLIAHTVFCPRRAWLEANAERVDSSAITTGVIAHEKVDTASAGANARSVHVVDPALGVVGRCDVIRSAEPGSALTIVEYKSTPGRRRTTVTPAMKVQLALQRLCLEAAGETIQGQQVYFINHKTTVDVEISMDEIERARGYVTQTREILSQSSAPPPLTGDDRCTHCSHVSVCLPDERRLRVARRRISVSDPDGEILHLISQGSRASLSSGRLHVVKHDEKLASLPLEQVRGLVVYGNVDISSALIRELCWRRMVIVWCSSRGRVIGWTTSAESPNGLTRSRQPGLESTTRIAIASALIVGKISAQATLLRRNARSDVSTTVTRLRALASRAKACRTPSELLGFEGDAAANYFRSMPAMLGPHGQGFLDYWPGRRARASTDPLNASLNFCYGLLLSDVIRSVVSCGLDPAIGVLHSSARNKPALALDLMEQFRPTLSDAVVLGAINNSELKVEMFDKVRGVARLRDTARRALVAAYTRRLGSTVTHPVFGYTLTWSRVLEVQSRLFLGVIDGSNPRYVAMKTR